MALFTEHPKREGNSGSRAFSETEPRTAPFFGMSLFCDCFYCLMNRSGLVLCCGTGKTYSIE